jgi:NAD(P)H-hydrate epimerase
MIKEVLSAYKKPVVLDADALNNLATDKELLQFLPAASILTPHPKEFERLFGETSDEFERIDLAMLKAKEFKVVIVLKGHHTLIATPAGKTFFNTTGNAGMATGGSGDVLTGMLTGLLAQGYSSEQTATLGVYLHGLAGDLAAEMYSMEAMIAGDIVEQIPAAFTQLAIL